MRRWVSLLLLFLPLTSFGQSIIHIPLQKCVLRSGDNLAWAAPNVNESGWRSWDQFVPSGTRFWIRCHADLSPLRSMAHPALQVASLYVAYQVFVNGKEIGGAGNMRTGSFSMDTIRQYPVPKSLIGKPPDTIAFRVPVKPLPGADSLSEPSSVSAGESDALLGRRARLILTQSKAMLLPALAFFAVGIAGLMLLGLYYYDRSRRELLYLSIVCISLAAMRVNNYCTAANFDYSSYLYSAVVSLVNIVVVVADILFFFTLARRRIPWLFWAVAVFSSLVNGLPLIGQILPLDSAYVIARLSNLLWVFPLLGMSYIVNSVAPFVAFWPWKQIQGRMRPLAALCFAWGLTQFLWFGLEFLPYGRLGLANHFAAWHGSLLEIRAIALTFVLLALLALLFRDQRLVTEERAVLAGEMQAAGRIQQMLVPASVQTAPNIKLKVAFQPMREVGGDFYQCRILPDGTQRILLGDVSGKGAAAAMSATLLIGASALCNSHPPQTLLSQLNQVLCDKQLGGFATCLCADISPNGTLTVANAGHLSPYRNGDEIELDSGLPLGITEAAEYSEKSVQLTSGDQLTFLSDGVIEARNPQGELYGFDRTREISTQTADQIAQAAQSFGQEDDITVLTLKLTPPEAAYA